ncbi:MAG: hypothetical protein H6582_01010 [Crocinitomicaceae bacterium]|nr:hypothetical protein [Crocinitomicaceae bacterium]
MVGLALNSCKEDPPVPDPPCTEDGLPCLTTTGENMFACKVNGQNWIAAAPYSIQGPDPLYVEYSELEGWLTINAVNKASDGTKYEELFVFGRDIYSEKNDSIRSLNPNPNGFTNYLPSNCSEYDHDTTKKGTLNIVQLDTVNKIISGTFSMDLFNSTCTDSIIHITDGRFDAKYAY